MFLDIFFVSRIFCQKNWIFDFEKKSIFLDKTRTVCQKSLFNKLVLSFWSLKRYAKAQSNLVILSKVIVLIDKNNDVNRHRRNNNSFSLRGSQNVEIIWIFSKLFFTQNQYLHLWWECKKLLTRRTILLKTVVLWLIIARN